MDELKTKLDLLNNIFSKSGGQSSLFKMQFHQGRKRKKDRDRERENK